MMHNFLMGEETFSSYCPADIHSEVDFTVLTLSFQGTSRVSSGNPSEDARVFQ